MAASAAAKIGREVIPMCDRLWLCRGESLVWGLDGNLFGVGCPGGASAQPATEGS
jgi:hypothetical protein